MAIAHIDKSKIEYITSSDINDDNYFIEVWYEKNIILTFEITDDYNINIIFGSISNDTFVIDLELFNSISKELSSKLTTMKKKFMNSNGFL